ncbi:MAG: hemolysin family protein [Peptoniphilus sp.]|nr:hemolysin family protein [Peptoniphilus sp.]
MNILPYIGIVICIIFSAFFSGSEIAFASVNKIRLRTRADSGNMTAGIALDIAENFNDTLSAILIGNNLVNIASSSIATIIAMELVGSGATLIATTAMTIIILIFGEITPKVVAKKTSFQFVCFAALPLKIIKTIFKPLVVLVVFLVDKLSVLWENSEEEFYDEGDLIDIIENIESDGVIDKEKSDLLQSALSFSDISVSNIITSRRDMLAIDLDDSEEEIKEKILNSPYSRIPVYEENIDNIIGILHTNIFLERFIASKGEEKEDFHVILRETLLDTCFAHETMKLHKVFKLLNRGKVQMAIVIDEYGGTMGCVTIEDLVEELVGEIYDEYDDEEKPIKEVSENTYELAGDINIKDLCQEMDLDEDLFIYNSNTIGGMMIERNNDMPVVGYKVLIENMQFEVLKVDGNRVEKVLLKIER